MKIVHVLYSGLGGHGNVFFSLIKADSAKVFEYEAIFAGVEKVREEYVMKSNAFHVNWKFISKKRGLDINFNKNIVGSIKNSESSIVFLHGSRFIILAKMAAIFSSTKKKIVVRETQANHLKTRSEWVWLLLTMLIADKIVFLTDNFREEVRKKLGWFYRPKKVSIISNGMDLDFFKPVLKQAGKTTVLGMQSRIVAIKDHITLLNAFAIFQIQHPEFPIQLKIAGDGDSLPAMQLLSKQLNIDKNVQFTGLLSETDLVSFMQSLDIYIHASLGETMSTAIMQANGLRAAHYSIKRCRYQ